MTSFNKVILLGNLTRDPEVRYTPNGTAVATFAIAVNEKRKDQKTNETRDHVSYFDIIVYGKQAENCGQYLTKGALVLIEGKLNQRRWDDKETGAKRSKVEIIANPYGGVTFMPRSAKGASSESGVRSSENGSVPPAVKDTFPGAEPVPEPPAEDDIPF